MAISRALFCQISIAFTVEKNRTYSSGILYITYNNRDTKVPTLLN